MSFTDTLDKMSELNKRGIKPGLSTIRALLDAVGAPDKGGNYIHIVGTNGKGSTARFISKMLREAGFKVGVFASPAVFNEREIITVNGRSISEEDYERIAETVMNAGVEATRFETETAMALLYFRERKTDFVVLEAGMGGALDATNVIENPKVCVFAAIGMDHMQYLGDTVENIAWNKAGIMKSGAIAVSGVQEPKVMEVLATKAMDVKIPFVCADKDEVSRKRHSLMGQSFDYKELKGIEIPLLGENQVENAILAIEAVKSLKNFGINVSDKAMLRGLKGSTEQGRFEVLGKNPYFVLDGAHNEPASERLYENLTTYFTKKNFVYIMGMLKDKDTEAVIRNTAKLAKQIITVTSPKKERALPAIDLANKCVPFNKNVTAADSLEEAVELASMLADKDTVIVVFGSLSILGSVRKIILNRKSLSKDSHGILR